jgi:hypothetical protein
MKFELSKFLQLKNNKEYLLQILEIINSKDKDIVKNRMLVINILTNIYKQIILITDNNKIDYYDYITPNKRVPCFIRNIKKNKNNNKNIKLLCCDDPHCIEDKDSCKLFVNKINLLNKKINNYNFYISKIADELLRYEIKREEILNDNIPIIINKEIMKEDFNKYVIIHTLNYYEINKTLDKLFLNKNDIFIDNRNLYENIHTKAISFKKEKYTKSNKALFQNSKTEFLSVYWIKYLGDKYNIIINDNNNLFSIMVYLLNLDEFKYIRNGNELFNINIIKNKIIKYIKNITLKIDEKNKITENNIIDLYKKDSNKIFKYLTSFQLLIDEIINEGYNGSEVDLYFLTKIYDFSIIILDKRIKKNQIGYKLLKCNDYKSNNFILLYKSIVLDSNIYNIIKSKNKVIFKYTELPQKFIDLIMKNNY